jgi:toxin-antitoxin system PIN domain toxin
MTAVLLDVNVLIALLWPAHEGHQRAQNWFAENAKAGWATCPFTQAAFVRIVSNPAFSRDAVTPKEAVNLLAANVRHNSHQFWADEIDIVSAIWLLLGRLTGHQQVTDAYLLGLARHKKGKLGTMDRAVAELLPDKSLEGNLVVVI